jgi:hypothetical protein
MDGFRQLAKNNPQLAMSALFQVDVAHPLITQGVSVHHIPNGMPAVEPFFMVQNEDPELDAMLEKIFSGDGDGSLNDQHNLGNQYFGMGMGNGTPGKSTDQSLITAPMLIKPQVSIEMPICCTRPDKTAEESVGPRPKPGTNTCGMTGIVWQSDSHRHSPGATLGGNQRECNGRVIYQSGADRASMLHFAFPCPSGLPSVSASQLLSKEIVPQRHVSHRIKFTPQPDHPRQETRTKGQRTEEGGG